MIEKGSSVCDLIAETRIYLARESILSAASESVTTMPMEIPVAMFVAAELRRLLQMVLRAAAIRPRLLLS